MCLHRKGAEKHSYIWGLASYTGRQCNRGTSTQTETERGYPTVSPTRAQSHERQGLTHTHTQCHSHKGATTKRNTSRDMVSPHTRTQPSAQAQSHTGVERWPWSHVALLYTKNGDQANGRDHCRPRQVRSGTGAQSRREVDGLASQWSLWCLPIGKQPWGRRGSLGLIQCWSHKEEATGASTHCPL